MVTVFVVIAIFFFQAEDGIRDGTVTGVQTCALPICLDTTSIRTRAVPDGAGYRITGRKVWMSKALESERVLLLTRTTPVGECAKRTDGLTLFVAPLQDPAVTVRPIPN